jgi:hypothetical protein
MVVAYALMAYPNVQVEASHSKPRQTLWTPMHDRTSIVTAKIENYGPPDLIEGYLECFNRVVQKKTQKSWGDAENKGEQAEDRPAGKELGKDVRAAVHKDAPGE